MCTWWRIFIDVNDGVKVDGVRSFAWQVVHMLRSQSVVNL